MRELGDKPKAAANQKEESQFECRIDFTVNLCLRSTQLCSVRMKMRFNDLHLSHFKENLKQ